MYAAMLTVHSLFRWVVVLLLLAVVVRSASAWRGESGPPGRLGLLATIAVDLQLLIGLALYGLLSPIMQHVFADFGAAMKDRVLRFWAVEHATLALLAVIAVHAGRVMVRRASSDRAKHRRTVVTFGIALVLVLLAVPWPFTIGRPWFRLGF